MLLAYLLFLLHLSASTCGATSRNHHLLLVPAALPAPSPGVLHDRKDLSNHGAHYYPAMMARRGGPPPLSLPGVGVSGGAGGAPSLPGVEVSGVECAPPPETGIGAAMEPSPSPRQVDDGGYVDDAGGGEEGSSSEAAAVTDQDERRTDDIGVDYDAPKTHPPSHN